MYILNLSIREYGICVCVCMYAHTHTYFLTLTVLSGLTFKNHWRLDLGY